MDQQDQLDQGKTKFSYMRNTLDSSSNMVDFTLPQNRKIIIRKINPHDLDVTDEEKDKIYENHKNGKPIFILKIRVPDEPNFDEETDKSKSRIIVRRFIDNNSDSENQENSSPEIKKLVVGNVICSHDDTKDDRNKTIVKSFVLVPPNEITSNYDAISRNIQLDSNFEKENENENETSDIDLDTENEQSELKTDSNEIISDTSSVIDQEKDNTELENQPNEFQIDLGYQNNMIQNNEIIEEEEEEENLDHIENANRNHLQYVNFNDDTQIDNDEEPPQNLNESDQNYQNDVIIEEEEEEELEQTENISQNNPQYVSFDEPAPFSNVDNEAPPFINVDNEPQQFQNMYDQSAQYENNGESPQYLNEGDQNDQNDQFGIYERETPQYDDDQPENYGYEFDKQDMNQGFLNENEPAFIITDGETPPYISREDEIPQELDIGNEMVPLIEKQFEQNFNQGEEED